MSDSNSESPVSLPPVWVALIPIAFLLVSMGVTIIVLGKDPHIPLILTAIVAALVARWHGASWTDLERGMLRRHRCWDESHYHLVGYRYTRRGMDNRRCRALSHLTRARASQSQGFFARRMRDLRRDFASPPAARGLPQAQSA